MKNKYEMVTEMILGVTKIGESYTSRQIKDRLFDWRGDENQRTNKNGLTRGRYIPTTNAMSTYIRKTKAFDVNKTRKGIIWTRKEVLA
tara:strand:- start:177 stop:440 length:264 start_codon:yes stop_codon:yes gene_type:complete